MLFGYVILATALLLSSVAAYYSIAGLTAIFAAATTPVIIMGGALELGKIVATVFLHKNWARASWLFKSYLIPAVAFLMLLTSLGIFGFLSKAHSDQSLVSGDSSSKVAIIDERIKTQRENIDAARQALKQLDASVDQTMSRSSDENGATRSANLRRSQQKERGQLQADIAKAQVSIAQLNEERAPLAADLRKVEAEVGPLKYIAALIYSDNPDANILEKSVRWVIILIVIVFDPLALCLILAGNREMAWSREAAISQTKSAIFVPEEPFEETPLYVVDVDERPTEEEKSSYEQDDGPLTKEQVAQIKETVAQPIGEFTGVPAEPDAEINNPFAKNLARDLHGEKS